MRVNGHLIRQPGSNHQPDVPLLDGRGTVACEDRGRQGMPHGEY